MARGVDDLGRVMLQTDDKTLGERRVWRGNRRGGNTYPGCLLFHHGQQFEIVLIEQNGRAGESLELERSAHVIDVAMGDEDLFEGKSEFDQAPVNACDFVAGIDDDGLVSYFVAENGAVALQRTDGKRFEDHASIVEEPKNET